MNLKPYFSVRDQNRGWKEIMRAMRSLGGGETYVRAGLIGPRAQKPHVDSQLTVAEVGIVHEYGSPAAHIPERSFVREPYDRNRDRYLSGLRVLLKAVYAGKAKLVSVLELIGSNMGADMRKAIREGIPPPLRPATVARKVAKRRRDPATPLLDTRQLVNTIRHEVVIGGADTRSTESTEAA